MVNDRTRAIEEFDIEITQPNEVRESVTPYGGISTAILIFTRGGETGHVWFYDMQSDGYSLDDKRNKLEGYGDLQGIITRYNNRNPKKDTDRKKKYFFVPKAEIVENDYDLSVNRYKEDVYEEIEYDPPGKILEKLTQLEEEISDGLLELKQMGIK